MENGRKYRAFIKKIDGWLLDWKEYFDRIMSESKEVTVQKMDFISEFDTEITIEDCADISCHIKRRFNPEDPVRKFELACALYFGDQIHL